MNICIFYIPQHVDFFDDIIFRFANSRNEVLSVLAKLMIFTHYETTHYIKLSYINLVNLIIVNTVYLSYL